MVSKNYIRYWRDQKDLTQQELGERANIARNTIARLESGTQKGSIETFSKIAKALNITIDEVRFGPQEEATKEIHEYNSGEHIPGLERLFGSVDESDTIPLFTSIPPGPWRKWLDQHSPDYGEKTVPRYGVGGKYVVATLIQDHSMIGEGLHKGDLIYINPEMTFDHHRAGRIGIACFNGNCMARRIFQTSDGQSYRLVPANPDFEEEVVPASEADVFKIVRWMPNTEGMF